MVGVANRLAPLQIEGYTGLLGDLGRKKTLHRGQDSAGRPLFPLPIANQYFKNVQIAVNKQVADYQDIYTCSSCIKYVLSIVEKSKHLAVGVN